MRNGRVYVNNKEFKTLLAIHDNEQAEGLMYREWPPPVMSFVYKSAKYNKFWMKNTPSPLDIVFCKNGKVHSIFYGEPYSTKAIGPDEFTDLVVEFPKGTCQKYGISAGDDIILIFDL